MRTWRERLEWQEDAAYGLRRARHVGKVRRRLDELRGIFDGLVAVIRRGQPVHLVGCHGPRDLELLYAALRGHATGRVGQFEVDADACWSEFRRAFLGPIRARRQARRIGLAYWPALLDNANAGEHRVDPAAYLEAERILSKTHGRWDPTSRPDQLDRVGDSRHNYPHGGWDMQGCHGISPFQVRIAWKRAGYRKGPRFALALRLKPCAGMRLPHPTASVSRWRNFVRGAEWAQRNEWLIGELLSRRTFSTRALRALGRLSAPLRWIAILGAKPNFRGEIGFHQLNWERVAQMQHKSAADLAHHVPPRLGKHLNPAHESRPVTFPVRDGDVRGTRIAWGESPASVFLDTFERSPTSRAEAHEWVQSGFQDPLDFVQRNMDTLLRGRVRNIRVAEWLVRHADVTTWRTPIEARLQDGRVVTVVPSEHLDEIDIPDLGEADARGVHRDSVRNVVVRALRRQNEAQLARTLARSEERSTKLPEFPWKLSEDKVAAFSDRSVRPVTTIGQLDDEGARMSHCVANYRESIFRRECYILSLPASTAELSPQGKVRQHRGYKNSSPSEMDVSLLAEWLAANGLR